VDTLTPIDAHGGQVTGSGNAITAPSITTTGPRTLLVGIFGMHANATISPPASMTESEEANFGTGVTVETAYEAGGGAGPTGTRTATSSSGNDNIGQLVALNPALGFRSVSTGASPMPARSASPHRPVCRRAMS
jgi:hypothetical protein